MVGILDMVVTPAHQQNHVHQNSGLNVKRLEEFTMEAHPNHPISDPLSDREMGLKEEIFPSYSVQAIAPLPSKPIEVLVAVRK
jgi:hypothetical protein